MLNKLKQYVGSGSIVVMPDFFVDRIIKFKSKEELLNALDKKANFGGGSIRYIPTIDIKGGNAVNVAYCLARLGAKVTLFTIADKIGSAMLRQIFSSFGDKVNLRIKNGKQGYTTAFEFLNEKSSKVNVMIADIGDNANFGPEHIDSEDNIKILENADAIMITNWASNLKGTQLAEYVFKNSPRALHLIDPADIESRREEFKDTLSRIAEITDSLSINENECNSLGRTMGFNSLMPVDDYSAHDVKNAATKLADIIGVSIDLHTRIGAAWSNGRESAFAHAIKVEEPKTLTGAGDSWDAANIIGYLVGLDAAERLIFSNVYASLYIGNLYAEPATMNETYEALE